MRKKLSSCLIAEGYGVLRKLGSQPEMLETCVAVNTSSAGIGSGRGSWGIKNVPHRIVDRSGAL